MSKIKINATIKNSQNIHNFIGKGIKKEKEIIYQEDGLQTKITFKDPLTIERKEKYYLKLNLKENKTLKGIYITEYGEFQIQATAIKINVKEENINIIYKLSINENYVDTFEYNLKISIDTK